MYDCIIIPVSALLCYVVMTFTFLAAKKNSTINSFIFLLLVLLVWTAGSFCMRMQFYLGVKFWFYVSIDALFLASFSFYNFLTAYIDRINKKMRYIWLIGSIAIILVNHVTGGVFISEPEVITSQSGYVKYLYEMNWPIAIPFAFNAAILLSMVYASVKISRTNEYAKKQLNPIFIGFLAIFLGNIATVLPIFRSFPIDILGGVVNALCMFYALYRRRMFKLNLLVSRSNCYIFAAVLSTIALANGVNALDERMTGYMKVFGNHLIIAVAVIFAIFTVIIYTILRAFFDTVFIREERKQSESIKNFSMHALKTLEIEEILGLSIDTIDNTLSAEKIYICLRNDMDTGFGIAYSSSPLDSRDFFLANDNPLVRWIHKEGRCLLLRDIKRAPVYRSMWESEKKQLQYMKIECVVPLIDNEELVGIVMLSNKTKKGGYTQDDLEFLDSLAMVGSIVIKNSRLYEKVYKEARIDDLTGVLNRKYFYNVLGEIVRKNAGGVVSLLVISLDDFKLFNQLYGTAEGDLALKRAAAIITSSVNEHINVARYSGKEFMVILEEIDTIVARNIAETIRLQIMNMFVQESELYSKSLTCSCGVCTMPFAANTMKQLIDNTEMAVYNAKRMGKNCVIVYSEGNGSLPSGTSEEISAYQPDVYTEYAATIQALTAAIDTKDHYTYGHSQCVSYYGVELARAYGLNADCVEIVKEAALLHDIGKIGIPEHILNKSGKLTDEEYEIMKSHVEQSINIIKHLPSLDYVIPAVLGHHERYDGRGYPRKLKGENIPLLARILCIADSFDAMVSKRSYKESYTTEYALEEIRRNMATQFDPALSEIFIRLVEEGSIHVGYPDESQAALPDA